MMNDKCSMTNDKCLGFSLIEVLVAISIMALLAVYLGARAGEVVTEDKFYETCYRMEEIKEAIIGRPGLYCNGIQQFTGYVSDMGNLPNLYYFDKREKLMKKVTSIDCGRIYAIEGDGGLAEAVKQGYRPQPRGLWRKTEAMPEWKYHEESHLWAGWRGPYIELQGEDSLKDAWGNDFLFVIGEVIGHEGKTYRCRQSYTSTRDLLRRPGEQDSTAYWEEVEIPIPFGQEKVMNFRIWQDLGTAKDPDGKEVKNIPESLQTKQEKFYGDSCLTIINLGRDGVPGGDGLDKDISIVIEPTEYLGEVAGNCGDRGQENQLAQEVCLYYPNNTEEGGDTEGIEEFCIALQDNSRLVEYEDTFNPGELYTGINFRFGTSDAWKSVKKWLCICSGGGENCYCAEYEKICLEYHCYHKGDNWASNLPNCDLPYPLDQNQTCTCNDDVSGPPDAPCLNATCSEPVYCYGDWRQGTEYDAIACECNKYELGDCIQWICDKEIPDCDCTETWSDEKYDDPNWVKTNIPIGIRTIKADSGAIYMFSVCPGGNWIGTVRGH